MNRTFLFFTFFLAGTFLFLSFSFAVTPPPDIPRASQYSWQIDECIKANASKDGVAAKTITAYVCPGGKLMPQQIAFQVILDLEFQKIDKEVEADLKGMQSKSTKDIGIVDTFIKSLFDETGTPEGKYPSRYKQICDQTVHDEAIKHFGKITTDTDTKNYFAGQSACNILVDKKMSAYRNASWLLGESAVLNSYKKDKHTYITKLKDLYEKFLNKWTIYIGQIGRIKSKWPSKTSKCM